MRVLCLLFVACEFSFFPIVITNIFRIGPIIEPEKLPVHGSLVGSVVELVTS